MNARQLNNLDKVRDLLRQARNLLDGVMYGEGNENLTEGERKRTRACYDKICEANDKI